MIETITVQKVSNGFRLDIEDTDFSLRENLGTYTEVLDKVDDYIQNVKDDELSKLDKMKPGDIERNFETEKNLVMENKQL